MENKPRDKWDREISKTLRGHWQVQGDTNPFAKMLNSCCKPQAGNNSVSPRTWRYFWSVGSFYKSQKSLLGILCCAPHSLCIPGVSLYLRQPASYSPLDLRLVHEHIWKWEKKPHPLCGQHPKAPSWWRQHLVDTVMYAVHNPSLVIGSPATNFFSTHIPSVLASNWPFQGQI